MQKCRNADNIIFGQRSVLPARLTQLFWSHWIWRLFPALRTNSRQVINSRGSCSFIFFGNKMCEIINVTTKDKGKWLIWHKMRARRKMLNVLVISSKMLHLLVTERQLLPIHLVCKDILMRNMLQSVYEYIQWKRKSFWTFRSGFAGADKHSFLFL